MSKLLKIEDQMLLQILFRFVLIDFYAFNARKKLHWPGVVITLPSIALFKISTQETVVMWLHGKKTEKKILSDLKSSFPLRKESTIWKNQALYLSTAKAANLRMLPLQYHQSPFCASVSMDFVSIQPSTAVKAIIWIIATTSYLFTLV